MNELFNPTYYPEEITEALLAFGGCEQDCAPEDVMEALYQIKAIAGNKLNSEYWRTLYYVLERITEVSEEQQRREKLELE